MENVDNLDKKLDSLFLTKQKMTGRDQADVTGLIGQYAHGNEPSHHIPYLYLYTNSPWKTQAKVQQIMADFYTAEPDGLCGNEDCGQMSAWYVMSALGLYAVRPGSPEYVLNVPAFPIITINRNEKARTILLTEGNLQDSYYRKSVSLNGNPLTGMFVSHADISGAKENIFRFETTNDVQLAQKMVVNTEQKGRQEKEKQYFAPIIIAKAKTFKDSLLIEIKGNTSTKEIRYTLNGEEPNEKENNKNTATKIYTHPFYISQNTTVKAKALYEEVKNDTEFATLYASPATEAAFYKINPNFRVSLQNCKPNSQYYADGEQSLIDGVRGDKNWRLGDWMGFQGQDVEVVVDLGKLQKVNKISLGCLQDFGSWIAMPKEVVFEIAKDGGEFEKIGSVKNDVSDKENENIIKDFVYPVNAYARRIRITAKNYGLLPDWHPGSGGETFIFMDEIEIE